MFLFFFSFGIDTYIVTIRLGYGYEIRCKNKPDLFHLYNRYGQMERLGQGYTTACKN